MATSGTVAAIRAEDGNLRYEYFFPMDDPETVLLIESPVPYVRFFFVKDPASVTVQFM